MLCEVRKEDNEVVVRVSGKECFGLLAMFVMVKESVVLVYKSLFSIRLFRKFFYVLKFYFFFKKNCDLKWLFYFLKYIVYN